MVPTKLPLERERPAILSVCPPKIRTSILSIRGQCHGERDVLLEHREKRRGNKRIDFTLEQMAGT